MVGLGAALCLAGAGLTWGVSPATGAADSVATSAIPEDLAAAPDATPDAVRGSPTVGTGRLAPDSAGPPVSGTAVAASGSTAAAVTVPATTATASLTVEAPPGPTADPPPTAVPASLRLPDLDRSIRVVPIGEEDGVLVPPRDIATAGWWVGGPRPGQPGRAVITGHIDSRDGLGAFAALDGIGPGDHFEVTGTDGAVLRYVVTDRVEVPKSSLDPAVLRGTDRADLLLVTCIGEFDPVARSYLSNLLITAVVDAGA